MEQKNECINEWMDGKEFDMDELTFGSLLSPGVVTQFFEIFNQQQQAK